MPFYFSLYFFFYIRKTLLKSQTFSNIQIEYKIYKNISWNLFMSNWSLQIEWTGDTTKIKLYFTSISILLHLTKLIWWYIINKFQMIFFLSFDIKFYFNQSTRNHEYINLYYITLSRAKLLHSIMKILLCYFIKYRKYASN